MNKTTRYKIAGAVIGLLMAPAAHATNGTIAHGFGTKAKGMGGVSIAFPQDALAAASNPAGMAFVGSRLDMGAEIFAPPRKYTNNSAPNLEVGGIFPPFTQFGEDSTSSDSGYFLIPHAGFNYQLDDLSTFGVSVYGAGMNSDYDAVDPLGRDGDSGTFGGGASGADILHLEIAPTYTRKFGDLAVGASAVFAYQQLEIRGTSLFGLALSSTRLPGLCELDPNNRLCDNSFFVADGNADNLGDRGHDSVFGLGGKIGVLWQVTDAFNVGLAYSSEVFQQDHDKYSDILVGDDDSLNSPAIIGLGFAWRATSTLMVGLDITHAFFSEVASFGQPIAGFFDRCMGLDGGDRDVSYCLGGTNGPGFGWTDVTAYKFGVQWQYSPDLAWRAGFNHGDNPVPSTEVLFNVLAPAVVQDHYTVGFTKKFNKNNEFDFMLNYVPENAVVGPLGFVEIAMRQVAVEVNWALRF